MTASLQNAKGGKRIVIPVDFSEYSAHACEIGFEYAHRAGFAIDLLHVFNSPVTVDDRFGVKPLLQHVIHEERTSAAEEQEREELAHFEAYIKEKINSGTFPEAPFSTVFTEGLPEEEIVKYCNCNAAEAIIMGTRGKNRKGQEMVGSVTAEVIEQVRIPVLAIPEHTPFRRLADVKRIAFATNFSHDDLIAFGHLVKLLKYYDIEYYLFHLTNRPDVWNEIQLAGIKEYFARQHEGLQLNYRIINSNNFFVRPLERFVREEEIDLISLTSYRPKFFKRLFSAGIARRLLFHTDTPLLALHG